jgi:hypothetical protein
MPGFRASLVTLLVGLLAVVSAAAREGIYCGSKNCYDVLGCVHAA